MPQPSAGRLIDKLFGPSNLPMTVQVWEGGGIVAQGEFASRVLLIDWVYRVTDSLVLCDRLEHTDHAYHNGVRVVVYQRRP